MTLIRRFPLMRSRRLSILSALTGLVMKRKKPPIRVAIDEVVIRPFDETDSIDELTDLLHRGYKILSDMGLRYLATYQDSDTTRKRIEHANCFVAVYQGKLIGTVTMNMPEATSGSPWLDREEVVHFQQFAVDPPYQGQGIGTRMVGFVEDYACRNGVSELALDTSEKALHLIAWYKRLGYRFIEYASWDITNYRSVVMSKTLRPRESPLLDRGRNG